MGWTGHYMDCPKGKERIAEVIRLEELNWENKRYKDEVIASSMYSTTCYFVIRRTDKADGSIHRYAVVCLTQYDKHREEFLIKVMDETMGPNEAHMPIKMVAMLSPINSDFANNWRRRCIENGRRDQKSLAKLPMGTRLRVNHPSKRDFLISTYRGRRAYIAEDLSCRITAATLNRLGYEIVK